MQCPRCKVNCTKQDLSEWKVSYDLPFGREALTPICHICLVELGRMHPIWTKIMKSRAPEQR